MRRKPAQDRRIAELASRQHGLVTRAQLVNEGLRPSAVDRRLRAGRLHVVHRGVFAVGHRRLSQEGRWLAAVLACGQSAVLSHGAAAALWGFMPWKDGAVEVTIPTRSGRGARAGMRLHRSALPDGEVTFRKGIRVTTPARTLLDLAEVVTRREVERALDEADYRGRLDLAATRATIDRNPRRKGGGVLRAILADHSVGATLTRSELEERFLALCRRNRIPEPEVNALVEGLTVDFLWPEARLIVETDGYAAHRTRAAFERDRTRDVQLKALGFAVLRFTYRQVVGDGRWVVEHLARGLGAP